MVLCSHCKQRKAKRRCPALLDSLCSLCCGRMRQRTVNCPTSCVYLSKHQSYQKRRDREKAGGVSPRTREGRSESAVLDERTAWLLYCVETILHSQTAGLSTPVTDGDVLRSLAYAKAKLERSGRRIIMPGDTLGPRDILGEAVLKGLEESRFEETIIITGEGSGYSDDEKVSALDRIIQSITAQSQGRDDSRLYIEDLADRFRRLQENRIRSDTPGGSD